MAKVQDEAIEEINKYHKEAVGKALTDHLSQPTRLIKRNLLLASGIGIIYSLPGVRPGGFLPLNFTTDHSESYLYIIFLVLISYLLAEFIFYIRRDKANAAHNLINEWDKHDVFKRISGALSKLNERPLNQEALREKTETLRENINKISSLVKIVNDAEKKVKWQHGFDKWIPIIFGSVAIVILFFRYLIFCFN